MTGRRRCGRVQSARSRPSISFSLNSAEKMSMKKTRVFPGLLFVVLAATASARASDRMELGFLSVVPPVGWHTETNGQRLLSRKTHLDGLPLLIIETCRLGRAKSCPSACALPNIERSGIVSDLGLPLEPVDRSDGYVEYTASGRSVAPTGTMYTSIRLLCGPAGFVYAARLDESSAEIARQELQAVVSTIKWTK